MTRAYERMFVAIAVIVLALWSVATLIQIIVPVREVPPYLNYIMVTVSGTFFGGSIGLSKLRVRRENGNGKNGGGHDLSGW